MLYRKTGTLDLEGIYLKSVPGSTELNRIFRGKSVSNESSRSKYTIGSTSLEEIIGVVFFFFSDYLNELQYADYRQV